MIHIVARNVPQAYVEVIQRLRMEGIQQESRNGRVIAFDRPMMLTIKCPQERVLFDVTRMANPFFHIAEFVWMMSGTSQHGWLLPFNGRMADYSDDGLHLHGAYGYRWREAFGFDQIEWAIKELKTNPTSRRIVIQMYSPEFDSFDSDTTTASDVPCNIAIMFRVVRGELDMTVVNRSNDVVWGMTGANAVHMTLLQELIANAAGIPIGEYNVFTNNGHFYLDMPNADRIWASYPPSNDPYKYGHMKASPPLLQGSETYKDFVHQCERIVKFTGQVDMTNRWLANVAFPMITAYRRRLLGESGMDHIHKVVGQDWQAAATQWVELKGSGKGVKA